MSYKVTFTVTVPDSEALGTEAAAHGVRDIKKPSRKARATIDRLLARYARLKKG